MLVTIKNVSLDKVWEEFGTKDFTTLEEAKIRTICSRFMVVPRLKKMKKADAWIMDKKATAKDIIKTVSVSYYMAEQYMEEEQRKAYKREGVKTLNRDARLGGDTYRVYAEAGLGFYELQPGQSVTCNFTERFLLEDMCLNNIMDKVEVTDAEGNQYRRVLEIVKKTDEKGKEVIDMEKTQSKVEVTKAGAPKMKLGK